MTSSYAVFLQDLQKDEIEVNRKLIELGRMIGFPNGRTWVSTAGAPISHGPSVISGLFVWAG